MPSTKVLLAALAAAVHSFAIAHAEPVASAPAALITPAPASAVALEKRQGVAGGPGTPILSNLHFSFTDLPNQVYPFAVLRGPQFGFNICNSTTLGPGSNCQTLIFNGPDDFCLWGSPEADGSIGNDEAKVVAYCTKPTHGTRVIPPGAITGLQWMKTSAYIQVSGFINNVALSLDPGDDGGELDPHGADLQGNPLGGVVYSNGTADSDGTTLTQVFNWNTFVGSGIFCFKACFNSITSPDYCENRYDLVGCDYNMPSAVQNGTYESCEGDLQDIVGTYTTNGQTLTWDMPATLTTLPPYTPVIPSSSNCQTFQSSDLFLAASGTTSASGASVTGTGTGATGTATGTGSGIAGATGASNQPSSTGSSTASPTQTGAAANVRAPAAALMLAGAVAAFML